MENQVSRTPTLRRSLIDQQLWFLGRDIAAADGNGPLSFGFSRMRAFDGRGSSAYTLQTSPESSAPALREDLHLMCWGFAIYLGPIAPTCSGKTCAILAPECAGIVIERFRRRPRMVHQPMPLTVHQVCELPPNTPPQTDAELQRAAELVRVLAYTLAPYERWARETLGNAHRTQALAEVPRHKRHRFVNAIDLEAEWNDVGCSAEYSPTCVGCAAAE